MELHELEPTGYFSEFSWVSTEDEEEDTVAAVDGADIFAAPPQSPLFAADRPAVPVAEQQQANAR